MAPPNAPKNCPRADDESSGPRHCALLECPLRLASPFTSTRGALPPARRIRLTLELDDTCACDVAERSGGMLTTEEIAILDGVSRQAVQQALRRAIRKVRIALRVLSTA
jgi:DNA-binding CsgD family transcriptional regulator